MKAMLSRRAGGPDTLVLEELADPVPGAGEVLIAVKACGVNYPDVLIIEDRYQFKPPRPFAPGGEVAGVVESVGAGVAGFKPGDRVIGSCFSGGMAEKLALPAEACIAMPAAMPFDEASALVLTYGTSIHALKDRARLKQGETLLVLGAAGGVGTAAVALGKAMGARVIAAASSEEKLDAAVAAGADLRIHYDAESLKDRVKELTGGHGADVVYDPVGGDYCEAALRAIAWDGRYLVIGFAAGEIPKIPLNLALLKSAHIIGVFWGAWLQRDPAASQKNFDELGAMFADGRLKPRETPMPLADFQEALRTIAERRVRGKLVLTMGPSP
jgi:NADPH2:quinone reductase